jgi:hypothetical protein
MADTHAGAAAPALAPVTEEAFLADRLKFWTSFTSFTTGAVIALVILLILMAIFLT